MKDPPHPLHQHQPCLDNELQQRDRMFRNRKARIGKGRKLSTTASGSKVVADAAPTWIVAWPFVRDAGAAHAKRNMDEKSRNNVA